MAQRRMLSMQIIDTDKFIQMPVTTRLLYYDYCMRADDDGFIGSPHKISSIGEYIIIFEKIDTMKHSLKSKKIHWYWKIIPMNIKKKMLV